MQVNQRLYLLSLLQSSGLQRCSLHLLFNALVINKLTYALPAYAGQLTVDDKNRINAISRKAMRRGLTLTVFDTDTLIDKSDRKLFRQATNLGHSLHHLLPPSHRQTDRQTDNSWLFPSQCDREQRATTVERFDFYCDTLETQTVAEFIAVELEEVECEEGYREVSE